MFTFKVFWPLLKMLSFIGFFPCQKVTNPESGEVRLSPRNACSVATRQVLATLLSYGAAWFCCTYAKANGLDFYGFFQKLTLKQSTTDTLSTVGSIILSTILHMVMSKHIWSMRDSLCEIQENFINYKKSKEFKESKTTSLQVFFSILVIGAFLNMLSMIATVLLHFTQTKLEQGQVWYLALLCFGVACPIALNFTSLFAFFLMYINVNHGLIFWIQHLKRMPHLNQTEDYLRFLKSLDLAKQAFSPGLFPWCFISLLIIILSAFKAVSLSMEFTNMKAELFGLFLGLIVIILIYTFIIFSTNVISQALTDQTQGLAKVLKIQVPCSGSPLLQIDGNYVQREKANDFVIEELKAFQGYDGNGFFTLGKSLLTAIIANVATYLIILIQFKMSENTTQATGGQVEV